MIINSKQQAALLLGVIGLALASVASADSIDVTGDTVQYSVDGKRAEFVGNVEARFNDSVMYADKLVVSIGADGNRYVATGSPMRGECANCGKSPLSFWAGQVAYDAVATDLSLSNGITVCLGAQCAKGRLTATQGEWLRMAQKAWLSGEVQGHWQQENEAATHIEAQRVEYDIGHGLVALRGGAKLSRDGNELLGESIEFNLNSGAMRADGGDSGKRVRAVFGEDAN